MQQQQQQQQQQHQQQQQQQATSPNLQTQQTLGHPLSPSMMMDTRHSSMRANDTPAMSCTLPSSSSSFSPTLSSGSLPSSPSSPLSPYHLASGASTDFTVSSPSSVPFRPQNSPPTGVSPPQGLISPYLDRQAEPQHLLPLGLHRDDDAAAGPSDGRWAADGAGEGGTEQVRRWRSVAVSLLAVLPSGGEAILPRTRALEDIFSPKNKTTARWSRARD